MSTLPTLFDSPLVGLVFAVGAILTMGLIAAWPYLIPPSDRDYEEEEAEAKKRQDEIDYGPFK